MTQHFNLTQSSKLADYLKKFDSSNNKRSEPQIDNVPNEKKRKISVEDESRFQKSFKQDRKRTQSNNQSYEQTDYRSYKQTDRRTDLQTVQRTDHQTVQKRSKQNKLNGEDRSSKLRNECIEKLMHSQFRNINQYLYENPTVQAIRYMTPELFRKYHESYSQLVEKWPVKPLGMYCLLKFKNTYLCIIYTLN